MTTQYNPKTYGELLLQTLPGVIETEEENEKALAIVERLMDKGENHLSPEEDRLFRLLVRLIEDFEDKEYPMGDFATPLDTLKSLFFEHKLKQTDLVEVFGTQSIVSEVLSGKRDINVTHAKRLSKRFNLPIDLFI
ncbi:MAG: transcriptional regulator [Pyrinomonadaceae bacterium]